MTEKEMKEMLSSNRTVSFLFLIKEWLEISFSLMIFFHFFQENIRNEKVRSSRRRFLIRSLIGKGKAYFIFIYFFLINCWLTYQWADASSQKENEIKIKAFLLQSLIEKSGAWDRIFLVSLTLLCALMRSSSMNTIKAHEDSRSHD